MVQYDYYGDKGTGRTNDQVGGLKPSLALTKRTVCIRTVALYMFIAVIIKILSDHEWVSVCLRSFLRLDRNLRVKSEVKLFQCTLWLRCHDKRRLKQCSWLLSLVPHCFPQLNYTELLELWILLIAAGEMKTFLWWHTITAHVGNKCSISGCSKWHCLFL